MNSPRSEVYDDVYFSEDGLAEKREVFVHGAEVPGQAASRSRVVIGELGFGTGLSMLATYGALQSYRGHVQFVSVEAHPLSRSEMGRALSGFSLASERWLELYPEAPPAPGVHHFDLDETFSVSLWIGDVLDRLREWDGTVDAWYLDGFAPAKNPSMWSDSVFAELARLSGPDTRLASYTAAGEVRRGLERAGFEVERIPGHGRKRHRIVGRYLRGTSVWAPNSVCVVGGGIAGASVARSLKRRGTPVTVIDSNPSQSASRNPAAVLSPRINRLDDAASRLHIHAFEYAARVYAGFPGFDQCGVLRAAVDEELADRFSKGLDRTALGAGPSRAVTPADTAALAGVEVPYPGVWLPEGGVLDPSLLLPALLEDVEIRAAEVEAFDFDYDRSSDAIRVHTSDGDVIADAVVIASGAWTGRWLPELPFRTSRGQLTLCGEAVPLRCVVSAHGYMTKSVGGHHVLGATYARGDEDPSVRREDHEKNLERLRAWAPTLADRLTVVGGRAAQRSQVPDHLPVVGRVGVLRVLGALGSRGFALAPLAAEVLVAEMCHGVPPLERAGRAAISPERYLVPAPTGPVGTD